MYYSMLTVKSSTLPANSSTYFLLYEALAEQFPANSSTYFLVHEAIAVGCQRNKYYLLRYMRIYCSSTLPAKTSETLKNRIRWPSTGAKSNYVSLERGLFSLPDVFFPRTFFPAVRTNSPTDQRDFFSCRTFFPTDILSPRMFCSPSHSVAGRFVPPNVLSLQMFCPTRCFSPGCFVPPDIFSLQTFFPIDVLLQKVWSPDALSGHLIWTKTHYILH